MGLTRRVSATSVVLVLLALLGSLSPVGPTSRRPDLPAIELASSGRPRVTFLDSAPDPHVIRVDDTYFAYATNGTRFGGGELFNVQRYESTSLASWSRTAQPDALPLRPAWAQQAGGWMWAPTVFEADDGRYVMFFTARSVAHDRQCIGRAVADEPDGTFVPTGSAPVVCQAAFGGSIDPYHFRNPADGRRYLYWKNDGNACQPSCSVALWGMELNGNGNLIGAATALVHHDQVWERPLIENPAMTYSAVGNTFRLFYSANSYFTESYATGYADCTGPLGPCRKITTAGSWHENTAYAKGPGGAAFFQDEAGKNWMAYHGYQPDRVGTGHARFLFVEKVDFHRAPTLNTAFPYSFHRSPPHPFVDVPLGHWAAPGIAWLGTETAPFPAAANGTVAAGFGLDPDETFGPISSITRAQLLNWVWNLDGSPGRPPPPAYPANPFRDSAAWVRQALDWASAAGLMTGYPNNARPPACAAPGPAPVFRPNCSISRAEYVRLLWRVNGSPGGYPDPGFRDVRPGSWVFGAVSWAAGEGHMTGYPDRTFRINLNIRRDQAANAFFSLYGP